MLETRADRQNAHAAEGCALVGVLLSSEFYAALDEHTDALPRQEVGLSSRKVNVRSLSHLQTESVCYMDSSPADLAPVYLFVAAAEHDSRL